jgi:membrane protease YdiL (CAAX protease family)
VTDEPRRPPFVFDAKLAFHGALAFVPLVVVFVPIVWALATAATFFADRTRPGHRTYVRAIWALAIFDLVVAAALVFAVTGSGALFGEGTTNVGRMVAPTSDPPKLGVILDPSHRPGARIERVLPGSPGEASGLRDGDVVTSVDGTPIATSTDLQQIVRETPPGASRRMIVEREGATATLDVTPSAYEQPARGLFEVDRDAQCLDWLDLETMAWSSVPLLLVIPLAIFVAVRSREPDRFGLRIWPVLFFILAVSLLGVPALVAWGLCALRGASGGDVLLALHGQVVVMALLGLGWKWWIERRTPLDFHSPSELRPGRVYTLGLVYILASVSRISAVVFIAHALVTSETPPTGAEAVEELVGSSASSVLGAILVVAAVAVIGPIAEEIVFRGVLLPWLGRHMSPFLAILTSSILFGALHPHYGPRVAAIFAIGAVLGWARWRTGKLWTSIGLHITVNGAFSLGLLAQ